MKKISCLAIIAFSLSFITSSCTEVLQGETTKKTTITKTKDGKKIQTTEVRQSSGLVAKKTPIKYRISDLPVPDRYRFNEDKSFVFETENLRTGILIYNGSSDITKVIDFYREEMPKYGWTLLHLFQHKDATMLFEKDDWICTVKIEGSWSSNTLSLTIAHKDPGSAPPPNR